MSAADHFMRRSSLEAAALASPRGAPAPGQASALYMQLALYAGGNALSLAIFLILYHVAAVLADFRDPLLYAFLCSIALRGPKDWLVARLDAHLADASRPVAAGLLSVAALPAAAAAETWREARALAARWRLAVRELREEHARRARDAAAAAHALGGAAAAAAAAVPPPPPPPRAALPLYVEAGLRALRARRERRRRGRRRGAAAAPRPAAAGSTTLLLWLGRACVLWACYETVRDAWSPAARLAAATAAATAAAVAAPVALLARPGRGALGGALGGVFSPSKPATPLGGAGRGRADWPGAAAAAAGARRKRAASPDSGAAPGGGAPRPGRLAAAPPVRAARAAARAAAAAARRLDGGLRVALRRHLHALVTLALMAGLLVGTTGAAALLAARIAGEGRAALVAARRVFPAAWAGIAAATPTLSLLADDFYYGPEGASGAVAPRPPPPPEGGPAGAECAGGGAAAAAGGARDPRGAWAAAAARHSGAVAAAQRALPAVAGWLEAAFHDFVRSRNLTEAAAEARTLYEALQGPRRCGDREREKLLVGGARANVAAAAAEARRAAAAADLDAARGALAAAVAELDGAGAGDERRPALEQAVAAADDAAGAAKAAHRAALQAADAAAAAARAAAGRLALCVSEEAAAAARGGGGLLGAGGALSPEVGARLSAAHAALWRRQLREGLAELRGAAAEALKGVSGGGAAAADGSGAGAPAGSSPPLAPQLASLRRLASAAADPLLLAGRLVAGPLGSSAAAALMGSLGLLRLGLGVFKAGVQVTLFLALLYYLLAARRDPLAHAARLLPLGEPGRARAAAAVNSALGGVFTSSLKLVAFHFGFTWLSFRAARVPGEYTAAALSAAAALLPFIPAYVVAAPAAAALAAQGRLLAGAALAGAHLAATQLGDAAILEDIPGAHPYLTSLAIFGGMYAFSNPLLGCVMGPSLLSLLSAISTLHAEFMGMGGAGGGTPAPAHAAAAFATPAAKGARPAAAAAAGSPPAVAPPTGRHAALTVRVPSLAAMAAAAAAAPPPPAVAAQPADGLDSFPVGSPAPSSRGDGSAGSVSFAAGGGGGVAGEGEAGVAGGGDGGFAFGRR